MPSFRLPRLPRAKQWLSSLVLATAFALYVLAGVSVTSLQPLEVARADVPTVDGRLVVPGLGVPPAPEPLRFREDVAPEDAVKINAGIPVSTLPNPAARPFRVAFATPADHTRAVECLAAAVYYEAGFESPDGQRAVAQVVLNRVRHPAFPKTVCGVVFQGADRATGCQFTFTCDGALARTPSAANWARARTVAEEALAGKVYAPVGWATHYHANYVVPYWSGSLVKSAVVGQHIFYRWEGGWGRPPAFRFGASGAEPQIALMRSLTSDPSTLADAAEIVPAPVDPDAAALAAAAANGDAPLQPGMKGAAAQGSIDSFQRSVLRRYEPPTPQQAANTAVAQTAQPSSTLHWALSGLPEKPQTPLGRKPAAAAAAGDAAASAPAPAAPVKCLEGVRRAPAAPGAAPQKETC